MFRGERHVYLDGEFGDYGGFNFSDITEEEDELIEEWTGRFKAAEGDGEKQLQLMQEIIGSQLTGKEISVEELMQANNVIDI